MKKILRFFVFSILFSGIIFTSCKKDEPFVDNGENNKGNKNFVISNDRSALNERITIKKEVVTLNDIPAEKSFKSVSLNPQTDYLQNYVFTHIAEVAPPLHDGHALQATHVDIVDHYAFVTYNTKGEVWRGGLEVFDVSDIENPQIISQVILPNTDINAVEYKDGKLYVVGANNNDAWPVGLEYPAFLGVISLNEAMEFVQFDTLVSLKSYSANDIKLSEDHIYTTSASDGEFAVFNYELEKVFSEELDHARSVNMNDTYVAVLLGEPGRLRKYRRPNHTFTAEFEVGGANTPASKTEIAANNKYYFAALNEGGLKMIKWAGGIKQHIPRPETPPGELDENYVTNSVTLNKDLLFIGNGEAGVYVGGIVKELNDSIVLMGSFQLEGSTNFVESKSDVLFVATGLGGLNILSVAVDDGIR